MTRTAALRPVFPLAARLARDALGPLSLVAALCALPLALGDALVDAARLSTMEAAQVRGAVQLFAGVLAMLAQARLLVLAARGEPARAGPALRFALRRWPAAVALQLVFGLVVSLGLVLLVVPGVLTALNLSLALPLLAATRLDAAQALRRSKELVWGLRARLLLPLALGMLATALPSQAIDLLPGLLGERFPALRALAPDALVWLAAETLEGILGALFLAVLVSCFQAVTRERELGAECA